MSAECEAFVEKYSPYRGTTYQVHLRLAVYANDSHGYHLWAGDERIAQLCRCSTKAVQRAKARLVHDGYLLMVATATGRRNAVYRFLMPEIGGQNVQPLTRIGGQSVPNRWTFAKPSPTYINKYKEKDPVEENSAQDVDFHSYIHQIKRNLGAL